MKSVHSRKVKFLWNNQKVSIVVRFISKSRDVIHDNKLVKYIIFSHYYINIAVYVYFLWKNVRCILNSSIVYGYLKSTCCWKQDNIFFSLSPESGIFDIQNISFKSPNILFFANFCIKVVFPQPVCPTIRMLPSNLPVGVIYCHNPSRMKYFVSLKISCFLATKSCCFSSNKK